MIKNRFFDIYNYTGFFLAKIFFSQSVKEVISKKN